MCSPTTAGPQRRKPLGSFQNPLTLIRRLPAPAGAPAFTLVELISMVGIIAFLIGIVMPAVQVARRGAQETACLTNLHLLGISLHTYLNENRDVLPDASSTNSWDSPYSPRGLADRGMPGYAPGDPIFGPRPAAGSPARIATCLPPIGKLLDPYMVQDGKIWRCPTQRDPETPIKLRSGAFVFKPEPSAVYTDAGEFRPGYLYLSTKEYQWYIDNEPETAAKYWMYDWIVRNVAGMSARTVTGVGMTSSDVALFMDYSSTFHARQGTPDVYTLKQDDVAAPHRPHRYQSNILYLDGHVDTKVYRWQGGLLNQVHRGIDQVQDGINYRQVYAENFENEFLAP